MFAAKFFKKYPDSNDADEANSFGYCLELGEDVDANIECGVLHYRKAVSQSHPQGLYNFARCLEYGKRIGHDFIRAAKHYCLAAELNDMDAQNNFGVCIERGLEFNRISCLRCTIISDRHSKAILTAQIILVSVSSTVKELSKTFDLRLNIIDLPSFAAILKTD
jgi:hypothetical protein